MTSQEKLGAETWASREELEYKIMSEGEGQSSREERKSATLGNDILKEKINIEEINTLLLWVLAESRSKIVDEIKNEDLKLF